MNIIDELKKNKCPFSLMSPPLQAKAHDIGRQGNFQYWNGQVWITLTDKGDFKLELAYRLRADYEEEPEIRQRKIAANNSNCLCMYNDEGQSFGSIANVHERPDFIGFKFEDGSWYDAPIKPVGPDGKLWSGNITIDDIMSGRVTILHASHVLFRRSK